MPDKYVTGELQGNNSHKSNLETIKPKKTKEKEGKYNLTDQVNIWQSIFDSISEWIVLTDLKGNIINSNNAGEKFINLTCVEMIGESFFKLLKISKEKRKNHPIKKALETCKKVSLEILISDGKWLEVTVEPVKDKDNKIESFINIVRDVSEKKNTEDALRISEHKYENIFTQTNDAIIYLDPSGNILELNNKAVTLFGSTRQNLINNNLVESGIISLKNLTEYVRFFKSVLADHKRTITIQIKNKKNENLFLDCSASLIKSNNSHSQVMVIAKDITPRKQNESILKETDQRYYSFVQKLSGIAFRAKIDSTPVFFHGSVELITGYKDEEFLFGDLRWHHIIHPDDLPVLSDESKKLHTMPNYSNKREYRIICKDGQIKWIHEIIQNDVDNFGKIAFVQGMIYDITERKLAEEKLVESEKRLQMAMEATQLGIWDWDLLSGKMTWDGCHAELFGIEREEFDGTLECFTKKIHPEDLPRIQKAVEDAHKNKKEYLAEYRVIWPDNTIHWVLGRGRCIYDQSHNTIRMLGTVQDITSRKHAEQELKKEHNLLRLLIDNIPDRIFVKDKENRFILGNNAVVKHHGLINEEELIGKTDFDFYPEKDAKIFYSEEKEVVEHGKSIINENIFYKDKNGKEEWSLLTKVPLKELNGEIVGLVGIKRNITELKITQNKLEETQKFLKALTNSVSDNLFMIDAEEKIIVANEAFSKCFNIPQEDIIDKYEYNFSPADSVTLRRKHIKEVFKSGNPLVFYDKRNGLDIENRLYPVKDKNDEVKYIAIFGRDITPQKKAEELLKKSELRFRNLFEQIPSGVALYKPVNDGEDFEFLDFNKAAEKIENIKKEDLLGKRVTDVFPGVKDSGIFKQFQQVLRTGKTIYSPSSLYKDERGSVTWRENWAYKLPSGCIVSFYNDITEIKLLEIEKENALEQLKKSEEKFRGIYEQSPIAIEIYDCDGKLIDINSKTMELFGVINKEHVINFSLWEDPNFPYEDKERLKNGEVVFTSLLFDFEKVKHNKLYSSSKSGTMQLDLYAIPLMDNQKVTGYLFQIMDITDRKQAEEALRESEEKFRSIVQDQTEFIVRWQPDGIRTFANEAYCKYYGVSYEEIIGTSFFKHISKDDIEKVKDRLNKLNPKNPVSSDEHRIIRPDGTIGWNYWTDRAIFNYKGELVEYQSTGQDITERKKSEEALKESENKYRMLFEHAGDYILVLEIPENGIPIIRDANISASKIHGYSRDELIGKPISFLDTQEAISHLSERNEILSKYKRANFIVTHKRKDGSEFNAEASVKVIEINSKSYAISIERDITERIKAEEAIRESEKRFRALSEAAFEGIAITQNGILIDANKAFARMYNSSLEELIGTNIMDLIAPEDRDIVLKNIRSNFDGVYEHKGIRKDGSLMYLEIHGHKIDHNGKPMRLTAIRDVTERKKAEEKLRESQSRLEKAQKIGLIGAWDLDIINNILEWTDQNYKIFGVKKGTLMNYEKFLAIVHPEDRDYVNKKWNASVNGEDYDIEHRLLVKNEIKWVREKAYLTFKNGKAVNAIGITQDITERKKAVEALSESETRFRRLFEEAPLGYQSLDEKGCLIDINQEWLNLLGYSREEVIGRWFGDFLIADQVELFRERFEVFKAIGITSPDFYMKKHDGSINIVHFEGRVVYDENGQFKQTHCILYDVTQKRKMEQELQKQVYLNRTLLDAMPCVAMLLKPYSHEIIASNQAAIEIGAVPGEKCYYSWMKQENQCPWCLAPELWKTGTLKHREIEYMQKVWDAYWIPVSDDIYMHFAFDITKHKEIEEKLLIHQNKLKSLASELTKSEASHNRKIASCLHDSIGQALSLSIIHLKKLKRDLGIKMTREIDNICGMIEDANETVRNLTFELASPTLEKLGLGVAIWELLNDLLVNNYDIEFKFNNNLEEMSIKPNIKTLLYRSIRELIINVIKHAQAENIEVDINHENSIIQIIVCDDGIGFNSQNEELYAQKDGGYGLFNIKEQIEYIGGSFKILSETGKGSKFLLTIPIEIIKD